MKRIISLFFISLILSSLFINVSAKDDISPQTLTCSTSHTHNKGDVYDNSFKCEFSNLQSTHDYVVVKKDKPGYHPDYTYVLYVNEGVNMKVTKSSSTYSSSGEIISQGGSSDSYVSGGPSYAWTLNEIRLTSEYREVKISLLNAPVFSNYDSAMNYLKNGTKDSNYLGDNFNNGNPEYPTELDKDLPCPQNVKINNYAGGKDKNNYELWNFVWQWNNKDIVTDDVGIELYFKMDGTWDHRSVFGSGTIEKVTTDWQPILSSNFYKSNNKIFDWYKDTSYCDTLYFADKNSDLPAIMNKWPDNFMYMFDTDRDRKIDTCSYKIRNYYIKNDKKYVSAWVVKENINPSVFSDDMEGDSKVDTSIEDDNGKDVSSNYDYKQDDTSKDESSASSAKDISFIGWLTRQFDAIDKFLTSVQDAFYSASSAGGSFVEMFKSYNSFLPSGFITFLVTGIGIVVLLRILGR